MLSILYHSWGLERSVESHLEGRMSFFKLCMFGLVLYNLQRGDHHA